MKITSTEVTDGFWRERRDIVRGPMLRHQWEALNDRVEGAAPSHAVENLTNVARGQEGVHKPPSFTDSDLAKWLEAAAYAIGEAPDPELTSKIESIAETYELAQMDDGYVNSYYQSGFTEGRWTNLHYNHELYCIGHFIEAAVAYERATGSQRLTSVARRAVEAVRSAIGPSPDQIHGYPGHEEIELALVKLADLTGETEYVDLARYFVDTRGSRPSFFVEEARRRGAEPLAAEEASPTEIISKLSYNQSHKPVREQSEAVGHSVRAMYLYAAMADLALIDADGELAAACRRLWKSATKRRMYVTGGIGSTRIGESFTYDHDLPSDIAYAETCAAIGLVFFARRMLNLEPRGEYGDVMERALYNGVLSGVSLDGKGYFYVNPLIVSPVSAAMKPDTARALGRREPWKECACCPPNVARLIASFHEYAWSTQDTTLFVHPFHSGSVTVETPSAPLTFSVRTDYPWGGEVGIRASLPDDESVAASLALRIPEWCEGARLWVDSEEQNLEDLVTDGYAYVARDWTDGTTVRLLLPMVPRRLYGAPQIVDTIGKVALQRGPLVYCLEEADNGAELMTRSLPRSSGITETPIEWGAGLRGAVGLTAAGRRVAPFADDESAEPPLYGYDHAPESIASELTFVPYFAWANRAPGEMIVWLRDG